MRRFRNVFIMTMSLCGTSLSAQPDTMWTRTFGGTDYDCGSSVHPTSDGGYIITGGTKSYGAGIHDIWLIKADGSGNKLWDKTFGGPYDDWGSSVHPTSDGGYIITGRTSSYGAGEWDVWLIKTDSLGNKLWDKTFGDISYDWGSSVCLTSDGGYIIIGYTYSYGAGDWDVWLIKTDSLGNKVWDKVFGGPDGDYGRSVQQTADGGYIITGATESYGADSSDVWLIKTDSLGNKVWDKVFGGTSWDRGFSVHPTSDGGYIITGETESYGAGSWDVWLIKTDSLGNKLWDKTFGDISYDWGSSVCLTSDGGYIITGETESYGAGSWDVWLIKTDSLGNKLWDKTFGGAAVDGGESVCQTSDGGYIITGGTRSYGAGGFDVWLLKIAPEGGVEESSRFKMQSVKVEIYPNPFTLKTVIEFNIGLQITDCRLRIYDLAGRLVKSFSVTSDKLPVTSIVWDGRDDSGKKLASGVYFCRLEAGSYIAMEKMYLIR